MGYDSTGWAYKGQRIKVIAKRSTHWIIELADGSRKDVPPSDLVTIKKVTRGLKGKQHG